MDHSSESKSSPAAGLSGSLSGSMSSPPPGLWRREHLTRPLRLADLTDDLLWTKLLRAAPMALRPARVLLAFFTLLIVALIWRAPALWPKFGGDRFLNDAASIFRSATDTLRVAFAEGLLVGALSAVTQFLFRIPAELVTQHPAWAIGLTLVTLPVFAIGGGAISRMVACEFSQCFMLSWTEALGMALRRRNSLVGAALAPLVIVGLLLAALSIGGWVLLNWKGINLLGAALYPLFLAGGFAAALILVGYAFGQCLLTPAVVCENTDAIDAMQRAYAYVIASPLRLVMYAAILLVQLWAVASVLGLIVGLSLNITAFGATGMASTEASAMVKNTGELTGTWSTGASIISFWVAIPTALVTAFMLSFYYSGSTVLYILLRRLNDGQDPAEIWTPALIPGTLAASTPMSSSNAPSSTSSARSREEIRP